MSSTLILLRHGQSAWNAENRFTGWVDVALSNQGSQEAVRSGERLQAVGLLPDVVHTSVLRRAITTANLLLDEVGRHWIPVRRTWRLNERHYGALQGKKKEQVLAEFGADQYMQWRRSYDVPPPPIGEDERAAQMQDPRYKGLGASFPAGECLRDVLERVLPHWEDLIATDLHNGSTVLVVAHGNAIRALIKYLDRLSDEEVVGLNVPTGMPLVFELSDDLVPIVPHGRYLDPARAATAAAAVAREGT